MTPLGYPASEDLIFPIAESRRKSADDIFNQDRYQGK